MWQEAIDDDPYWQFEDLLEENPEEAERVWDEMRIKIIVNKRMGLLVL